MIIDIPQRCTLHTATTPDTFSIHAANSETRMYPSGYPNPHATAHDVTPINCFSKANRLPESPEHTPLPLRANAHMVPLLI